MIKKLIIAAMVAGSLGSMAVSASAREVIIRVAPPELRVESVPAARHGYHWAPGYWNWSGQRHVWVRGTWMRERPGYYYRQPSWQQRDGNWHIQRGNWARGDKDHDGVPNRIDRDRDGDGVPNRLDNRPDNPNRK